MRNGPLLTVQTGANPFDAPPAGPPPTPQGVLMRYPGGDDHVLSGLMRGANEIRNRPAIVDQPSGKGRVILFAGNPCYRWQNFGEFNMLFNTVLNFNDIKTEPPEARRNGACAVAAGGVRHLTTLSDPRPRPTLVANRLRRPVSSQTLRSFSGRKLQRLQ